MQGYIKKGSVVGQDFSFFKWDKEEQIFNLEISTPTRYICTANGYGVLGDNGKYGNGSTYAKKEDVVVITPPIRENDRAY